MPLLLAPALVAVLPADPAGAHAFLAAQFPADGQLLDAAAEPTTVRYEFNAPVTVEPAGLATATPPAPCSRARPARRRAPRRSPP